MEDIFGEMGFLRDYRNLGQAAKACSDEPGLRRALDLMFTYETAKPGDSMKVKTKLEHAFVGALQRLVMSRLERIKETCRQQDERLARLSKRIDELTLELQAIKESDLTWGKEWRTD